MTQSSHIADIEAVHQLLTSYSFEVESYQTKAVVAGWLAEFGPVWVSHAITEALYQGRYKLISVDQILRLWQRRGQPIRHFNREFESIILGQTLLFSTGYGDGPDLSKLRRTATPTAPEPLPETAPSLPTPESAIADNNQAEVSQVSSTSHDSATDSQSTLSPADKAMAFKDVDEPAADTTADSAEQTAQDEPVNPTAPEHNATTADETDGAVPDFRPVAPGKSSRWPQIEVIQTFVPRHDESELHERLRAVVQGGMQDQ